ncbi:MAG TPA: P1 family peptidase [Chloroflexia bacterium]|nr:P1 family peptidase [Chloroflexia bacterium]
MAIPRARDLGVPFEGTTGQLNAITDVAGVEVGHVTLISGEGALQVGKGPVRTGVTAVLPRGKSLTQPVFAGWFSQNGNGEMTGTTWIQESGFLEGPVMITNTHSVGLVRDAVIAWQVKTQSRLRLNSFKDGFWSLPVVAETYDGYLNDINGFHVKEEHVFAALDGAQDGPVEEGSLGGGTGMVCFQFKGGIGTASRKLDPEAGGYTVGVLAQCNFGLRRQLLVAGVPVGQEIPEEMPGQFGSGTVEAGSIIIIVATDAPLLPHQLTRIARRATMGLARTGSTAGNGSGDIFVAFSTANPNAAEGQVNGVDMLNNNAMSPLFDSAVQATEEAIVNALVAARTMVGRDNNRVSAIPHERLKQVLKKYNRLAEHDPA